MRGDDAVEIVDPFSDEDEPCKTCGGSRFLIPAYDYPIDAEIDVIGLDPCPDCT